MKDASANGESAATCVWSVSGELKETQRSHEECVRKLIGLNVSWRRIIKNNLDDPRMSEGERNDLLTTIGA